MGIQIKVPDIGIDEVEITEILVKVGDKIQAEQPLMIVEGDKASMEIPSPQAGIVKEIKVSIGDKTKTGKLIMLFDSSDNGGEKVMDASGKEKDHSVGALQVSTGMAVAEKEVKMPDIGISEVEVIEIMIKVGDKIQAEQPLMIVEGDKASVEVPAPFPGTVKEIKISAGDKVSTGSIIMVCEVEIEVIPSEDLQLVPPFFGGSNKPHFSERRSDDVHATPIVRRLARKFGVNLENVIGTGRKGRILREDVEAYLKGTIKCIEASPNTTPDKSGIQEILPWPKVNFRKFGEIEEIKLARIQKISGANLRRNWITIPHVTHFDKVDITDLENFRKEQNTEAVQHKLDLKFNLVVFIVKAVSMALEQMPRFNSSLSEDGEVLTLKKYVNIGVAVDTPNGLVVPVFKDVKEKNITALSRELTNIFKKARGGKLTVPEMQGGCFTISSIGGLGTTYFAPIVNAPEVAILGVSKAVMEPVWNGKEFVPRLMMPISLSFDHRVIDGADGARFITIIKTMLSDIRRLLM